MKKILNTLFVAVFAISFNVNASTFTNLTGASGDEYYTGIVSEADILAQSTTVDGYNIDPIIAYTSLGNSGDPTEIDWMTAVFDHLGTPYDPITSIQKLEFDTEADSDNYWTCLGICDEPLVDDNNRYYTGELDYANDHYLIKIGQGKLTYDTFLYENLDSLFQATIDLMWLDSFSGLIEPDFDIYRVSHISVVPIPAAGWLFGSALLGFVGFARRRSL